MGVERMLRMSFLQQGYALADEALEDALYDRQALRAFVGLDLAAEAVPEATTLLGFRHLLERHGLTRRLLEEISVLLAERGVLLRKGTRVDATIIAAPSSTKNAATDGTPRCTSPRRATSGTLNRVHQATEMFSQPRIARPTAENPHCSAVP